MQVAERVPGSGGSCKALGVGEPGRGGGDGHSSSGLVGCREVGMCVVNREVGCSQDTLVEEPQEQANMGSWQGGSLMGAGVSSGTVGCV